MKKPTIETHSYIDSPLAKILANVLDKISSLRRKYPVTNSSSAELKHATKQVQAIEQSLILLNQKIFPEFDKQQLPSSGVLCTMIMQVGLLKDLYDLFGPYGQNQEIWEQLQEILDASLDKEADSLMIFELTIFVAELMDTLPKKLMDLIPFFNPKAIEGDFHSNWLMRAAVLFLFGFSFKLKKLENKADSSGLVYERTRYQGETALKPATIDASEKYLRHSEVKEAILFALLGYVKSNVDRPEVLDAISSSELLKTTLTQAENLKQYIDDGIRPIKDSVNSHLQSCQLEIDSQLKGLELIQTIDARIQESVGLFEKNRDLQFQLDAHYSQHTAYPEISWDKKLNTLDLPAYKADLDDLIVRKKREVAVIHKKLEERVTMLGAERSAAVTAWGESIVASYSEDLKSYMDNLTLIVNESNNHTMRSIKSTAKKTAKQQNNSIEALELEIKHLEQKSIALEECKTKFIQWSTNYLSNCAQLPWVLGDVSLQQKLTSLEKQLKPKALDMQQQIDLAIVEVKKNKDELQSQLSAARFASVLSSANPEQMKQLLKEKIQKLDELQDESRRLGEQLAESESDIIAKNKATDEILNIKNQDILGLIKENQETIKLIRSRMGNYHNPEEINGWSKVKTGTDDECIQWILSEDLALMNVSGLQELSVYKDDSLFLSEIKNVLFKEKTTIIPLNKLDELAKTYDKYNDENWLFTLLEMNDSLIKKCKENYLQRNDFFKPSFDDFNELRRQLKLVIDSQEVTIGHLYVNSCNVQDKNKLITKLLENQKVIAENSKLQSKIENEQTLLMQMQWVDDNKSSEQHKQLNLNKASLEKEQQDHLTTINILDLIVNLLDEIKEHGRLINLFKEGSNDLGQLSEAIAPITLSRNALIQKEQQLSALLVNLSGTFENITIYNTKKADIQGILQSFDKRIDEMLGTKYKNIYFDPISSNQAAYDKLYSNYLNLRAPDNTMPSVERRKAVRMLLLEFNELSNSMLKHDKLIITPHDFISNPSCNMKQAIELQTDLQEEINKLGRTLKNYADNQRAFYQTMDRIAKYTQELVELGEQAKIQEVEYPEASHQAFTNKLLLDGIEFELSQIADDETFLGSKESILDTVNQELFVNALTELQKVRTTVLGQLQRSKGISIALEYRIGQRSELVMNQVAKLTELKDQISPEQRLTLNGLVVEMNNYQELGESTEVLEFIRINRQQFVGTKLQLILNQLTVAIIDLDRQKPTDYSKSIQDEIDFKEKAKEILATFNDGEKLIYANKIKALRNQIQKMEDFGQGLAADDTCQPIVIELVNQLKNDIDRFVILHPNELPASLDYQRFEDQFAARLQSKDDEMSPHWATWKLIIANTLIALTLVGAIALGIQLIHSKVTTGQCSFFFEKSKSQQLTAQVGESVKEILANPPLLAM